jgi:hypothetical protein
MTLSMLRPLALAVLAFAVVGCDQGRTNPADATVRIVNVAPRFPALTLGRGAGTTDNVINTLAFKEGVEVAYDEDTYNFHVYVTSPASVTTDKLQFTKQVTTGTLYTIVLTQSGSDVQELILETQPPAPSATDTQVVAAHAAEGLPAMDLFLEPPGTDIAGAVAWGSVSFLGTVAPRSVPAGDYELTLTAAGNRADVLLTSTPFTLAAAASTAFVITAEANEGLVPVSVTVVQGTSGSLLDRNSPAAVRVINAATDAAPRDVAINGQFSPPLFSAVPFAAPTAYVPVAPGTDVPLNVTPVGNPGVLELDQKITSAATRRYTLMFIGDAGALTHVFAFDDGRAYAEEAQVRFYNGAKQFTALDVLLLATGGVPTATMQQATTVGPGAIGLTFRVVPNTYDLYLRRSDDTTVVVAGPIPVTLAAGNNYGVLATNGPDAATATVTLIDAFQP